MTYFLKSMTGLDPLTISQTHYSERSVPEKEHPWRRQAAERGLLGDRQKVLMNSKNNPVGSGSHIDIPIFGLHTRYENKRPVWMSMGGIRQPVMISTAECENRSCVVEVFDPTVNENAIPFDRLEVVHSNIALVYIPANKIFKIRILDLDGNILFERFLPTK